ncbi:MAG: MurR/RpiR family transcriptional regulator [Rhodospirillales bacterium]|nr:MurR/RpiR family transcriptional regulator [Rhodospirillales bacterium]
MAGTSLRAMYYSDTANRIAHAYALLSKSHKKIADFVLGAPAEAAMMTIDELAKACLVSNATANRFAKAIGFDGFADFRARQIEAIKQTLAPVEKLKAGRDGSASSFDIISDSIRHDLENLEKTRETLAPESCGKAVDLILAAERIFIFGSGISYYIAGILTHGLEPFCRGNVSMMGTTGGVNSALRRLVHAGERDLAIFISFPRYAPDTLELVEAARRQGARILCITDRPTSPLARYADVALYVQAERRLLPNSATAAFALADGLAAAVANRRREGVDIQMRLAARYLPGLAEGPGEDAKRERAGKKRRKPGEL